MAMGVTIDPSYAFPLPIFGINYLDFEFGSPDTQLALLFARRARGGKHPAAEARVDTAGRQRRLLRHRGAVARSHLRAGWRARGPARADVAALRGRQSRVAGHGVSESAVSVSVPIRRVRPRSHDGGELRRAVEHGDERLRRRVGIPARRIQLRRQRHVVPAADCGSSSPPTTKYTASLSRDWYFKAVHKMHLNGAWFGGQRLDRFSKYQFGMFDDTRIHGVPASGVRFDELAWRAARIRSIFRQYRLDLFLDQAWGRDADVARAWRAADRPRRGREFARAVEYDSARRHRQELPAGRLRGRRIDNVADHAAETIAMMMRADLHVHTLPLDAQRQRCGFSAAATAIRARRRLPRARRRAAWIWSPSPTTTGSTARSSCWPASTGSRRRDRRRRSVVLVPDGHRGAPRRLRHDRGAAPRPAAAAPQRVRRDRVPARGRRVLFAEPPAAFLSRADAARPTTCACWTRCRRSRPATARCCRRTTCSSRRSGAADGRHRRRRSRRSAAATRTRCGASAARGPRRPGANREEFLDSLRAGWAARAATRRPRRRSPAMRTASSRSYIGSLVGLGPRDHAGWRRAGVPRVQRRVAAVSIHAGGDCARRASARKRRRCAGSRPS